MMGFMMGCDFFQTHSGKENTNIFIGNGVFSLLGRK
jgi:diphthamide synthase subunit DPH2